MVESRRQLLEVAISFVIGSHFLRSIFFFKVLQICLLLKVSIQEKVRWFKSWLACSRTKNPFWQHSEGCSFISCNLFCTCQTLPAMFPRAQTACSHTLWLLESSSFTKCGTDPAFTTALVWSLVPEAMFVSAHADSNCNSGLRKRTECEKYFKT